MSDGQGTVIARRSLSLSKSFVVVGIFLAAISVLISGLPGIMAGLPASTIPTNSTGSASVDLTTAFPLFSVALQVFAAITFSTAVLLLYVYDKNNGVLEYFLSLGMTQGDIYMMYLKAALLLSSGLLLFEILANLVVGLVSGTGLPLVLEASLLTVVLAIPVVSFGTLLMMSFSSLQKQRAGANQPLGMAIGVFMVMPAYIIPLVLPSLALVADLVLATVIGILAVLMYLSSSRLIRREKLLP